MPAINTITPDKLARLIGMPNRPAVIDIRTPVDFATRPRLISGAVRRGHTDVTEWSREYSQRDNRPVNQWAADHTMTLAGSTPILALDMYEHAYAMDYGAKLPPMLTRLWEP